MTDCLFCRIVTGDIPAEIVHRGDHSVAFRDLNPVAPVHVLVIPITHISSAAAISSDHGQVIADMFVTAQAVAESAGLATEDRGYRLTFNVGPDAGMTVPHIHMHVLGGRSMDWPPG